MPKPQKKKEMHSQVERRRRERIRCETERLLELIPNAESRDRLSTFQNALARLSSLTEEVGPRNDLLTFEEILEIVHRDPMMFRLDISKQSAKVLYAHANVQTALGHQKGQMESSWLSDYVRNFSIISDLLLQDCDASRQVTLLFRVNPSVVTHCDIIDTDGRQYSAFITVILPQIISSERDTIIPLICCKRSCTPSGSHSAPVNLQREQQMVTFRLNPISYVIENVTENCKSILDVESTDVINTSFVSLAVKAEQMKLRTLLNQSKSGDVKADNLNFDCLQAGCHSFAANIQLSPVRVLDEVVMLTASVSKSFLQHF